MVTGIGIGLRVGRLVVYANLSSLIATLGTTFMLRGLIQIRTEGKSIALPEVPDSLAGVFAVFIEYTWWPTSGDSYLLLVFPAFLRLIIILSLLGHRWNQIRYR